MLGEYPMDSSSETKFRSSILTYSEKIFGSMLTADTRSIIHQDRPPPRL